MVCMEHERVGMSEQSLLTCGKGHVGSTLCFQSLGHVPTAARAQGGLRGEVGLCMRYKGMGVVVVVGGLDVSVA